MRKWLLGVVIGVVALTTACAGDAAEPVGMSTAAASASSPTAVDATPTVEPEPVALPASTATAEPVPSVMPEPTSAPAPTPDPETTPQPEPTPTVVAVAESNCRRLTGFDEPNPTNGWFIVNDGVMGGRSISQAAIRDGVMRFSGTLVTAGGGFSSVRFALPLGGLGEATELRLRARTDGREYEVVAEDARPGRDRRVSHYADIAPVPSGEWTEIEIDLSTMQPRFFGEPVVDAALDPTVTTTVGLFLADGVDGEFMVEVDWIDACRPPQRV